MDVAEHIVSLERSALDRWIRADPDGYLGLYARGATYFDPFREKRADGLDELNAWLAPMRGMTLPFTEPRYDMINPLVQVESKIAVLTFNLLRQTFRQRRGERAGPLECNRDLPRGRRRVANHPHTLVFHPASTGRPTRRLKARRTL
ncbi:MAG: hypothetical protein ACREAA_08280 [Candidatus Polarisedimenticolia bacterium]